MWSIVQWEPKTRTVWGALEAAYQAGSGWPRAVKIDGQKYELEHFDMESVPHHIRDVAIDEAEVIF